MWIDITPVPKPRQTRADKWQKRPAVIRYRAFADELRYKAGKIDLNHHSLTFGLPMPKSWSEKKKQAMDGQPHTQKPDLDNLLKAVGDALNTDDSGIHTLDKIKKVWSRNGYILFEVQT